ncbi:MAG: histidine phosphatase family protein [Leptolyngbya sp. SIO3F4]|nr:histidine phosphatase family protein [Leptolyngbya sp. SIO3F4]
MQTEYLPKRIILVRHGRSTFNDQGRYQGSSDEAVLTLKGIETARQVGEYLQTTTIDAVYTSPLLRAKQTTEEILKAMADKRPKPITVSGYLREIDLSVWEGLTYDYVRQHHKEAYDCWQQHPDEFKLPAADNGYYFPIKALYKRAQKFWTHILPNHAGKTLLVVSHGGTNHALISTALDLPPKHHHSLQQSNCGISILDFSDGVQLNQLNQTTVIKETLPKLKAGKQGLRLFLLAEDSLTTVTCRQLAQRLATIQLNFCLSVTAGQKWLPTLLEYQPRITRFVDEKDNFLQDWQQAWTDSFSSTQTVMTGLAIAPTTSIQTLLMQTLGGHPRESPKISLKPGHLSVINYPKNHRPIVQAINI